MSGRNLGYVGPIYGRWIWPFKQMRPGDWFVVEASQRDPEKVRHTASVRAAQLGKRISVEKNWQPGLTRVTCVDEPSLEDVMC